MLATGNQADLENIIFTFKVNKKFYFTKSLKEVDQFCKEFSQAVKSPLILGLSDLFAFYFNE